MGSNSRNKNKTRNKRGSPGGRSSEVSGGNHSKRGAPKREDKNSDSCSENSKSKPVRKDTRQRAHAAPQRLSSHRPYIILFEDQDLIAAYKRAGLLSVPVRGTRAPNLFHMLNTRSKKPRQRVLVVHRIDRYTSGIVIYAKNKLAWERLVEQFKAHTPKREYLAIVRGKMPSASGELCHYMRLTKDGFRQQIVSNPSKGTKALLYYKVIEEGKEVSLVQVQLDTGLKNQIRVQFMAAGHPIVGDQHYAVEEKKEKAIDRQALHSSQLAFKHPKTGNSVTFKAPIPADFKKVLQRYGLRYREDVEKESK